MSKSLITRPQTDSLYSMGRAKGVSCAAFQQWLDTKASALLDALVVGDLTAGISAPLGGRIHAVVVHDRGVEKTYVMLNYPTKGSGDDASANAWAAANGLKETDGEILLIHTRRPNLNREIGESVVKMVSTKQSSGWNRGEVTICWWDGDHRSCGSCFSSAMGYPTVWFVYLKENKPKNLINQLNEMFAGKKVRITTHGGINNEPIEGICERVFRGGRTSKESDFSLTLTGSQVAGVGFRPDVIGNDYVEGPLHMAPGRRKIQVVAS